MTLTRRGKAVTVLVILGLLLGAPIVAGYVYLRSIGFYGESDPGKKVQITIPKGAGTETIGKVLEENGVIDSAFGFRLATYFEAPQQRHLGGHRGRERAADRVLPRAGAARDGPPRP